MEEVSNGEEKIKLNESILRMVEEKIEHVVIENDGTKNDGMITAEEAEEEYNAIVLLVKLFKEMDNLYVICKAIIDEIDHGEETLKNI